MHIHFPWVQFCIRAEVRGVPTASAAVQETVMSASGQDEGIRTSWAEVKAAKHCPLRRCLMSHCPCALLRDPVIGLILGQMWVWTQPCLPAEPEPQISVL